MSVRRWIAITGIVVAVAAGTAATARAATEPAFEAEVSLLLEGPPARDLPAQVLRGAVQAVDAPEVRELVRERLGETTPVWVTAAPDGTILVRSRGATRGQATEAARTYAQSYVDVKRRHVEAEASAAAEQVLRKTDQIKSQLESAEEPQRTYLLEVLGLFNTQLDRLQLDLFGPQVVGSTPAARVDHGWGARLVAVLGATVAVGAAVSGRRTRPLA